MATERQSSQYGAERRVFIGLGTISLASLLTAIGDGLYTTVATRHKAAREAPPPDPDDLEPAKRTVADFHTQVDQQVEQALAQGDNSVTVQVPLDKQTEIEEALQVVAAEAAYEQRRNELESVIPPRIWGEGAISVAATLGFLLLTIRKARLAINQSKTTPNLPEV